jgi:CubicO group peptidase (beta-lactamase class C family)
MRALLALLLGLGLAGPAGAQDVDSVDRAYARWITQHGIARATLAVARGDRLVLAKGYGGLAAGSRVLLGSLSKAITATCTVTLIQQGKLRFDTPLGELLDRGAAQYGEPRDARLRRVTVEQMLTHRAGFARPNGDPATGRTLAELLARRAVTQVTMHDLVPGVLRTALEHDPGTQHAYTNAPHLLLGIGIEAVTGQPYERHCAEAVLRPQGIAGARLHEKWAVLGSFGGWNLSGPEYLAFFRAFAPSGLLLTPESRTWLVTGAGKEVGSTAGHFYTLLYVRPLADGRQNFFHTGSWGYRQAVSGPSGGINDSIGTLAVRWASGASLFAYYEPRPGNDARAALDRELSQAVAAVRAWPETDLYPALGVRPPGHISPPSTR